MSGIKDEIAENIKVLLQKDIYMPYELIEKIRSALPYMPQDKLVELLLVLQEASSKTVETLSKLFSEDSTLAMEYKSFINNEFSNLENE